MRVRKTGKNNGIGTFALPNQIPDATAPDERGFTGCSLPNVLPANVAVQSTRLMMESMPLIITVVDQLSCRVLHQNSASKLHHGDLLEKPCSAGQNFLSHLFSMEQDLQAEVGPVIAPCSTTQSTGTVPVMHVAI